MKIKTQEKLDAEIAHTYYELAAGQMIDIFDVPKVFADSRRAIASGAPIEQAVRAAVLMYCNR